MERELDRQTKFERLFMDDDFLWGEDWFIDDATLEGIELTEYRMYLIECDEVELENAE